MDEGHSNHYRPASFSVSPHSKTLAYQCFDYTITPFIISMFSISSTVLLSAYCLSYSTRSCFTSTFLFYFSCRSVYSYCRSICSFFSHSYSSTFINININININLIININIININININNYYYDSISTSQSLVSSSSIRQTSPSTHTSSLLSNKRSIHSDCPCHSTASHHHCLLDSTVCISSSILQLVIIISNG